MINLSFSRIQYAALAVVVVLLNGCSMLLPAKSPPPSLYSFDIAQAKPVSATPGVLSNSAAPTLVLSIPSAAAGFDTQEIVYVRQEHKLEHFRDNRWVDTPASMLSPLLASALERSGAFGAVVQTPTSAAGQYRLDVELVRLQHEFLSTPSRAHVTLRAHLLETANHKVIAWREFDAAVPAASEDPYGGVVAANLAVRIAIEELAVFCAQAVAAAKNGKPVSSANP